MSHSFLSFHMFFWISNSDLFILDSVRSVITDSFASWFSTTGQNDGIIGNQSSPDDVMQRTNQNWMTTEANIEYNTNENSNSPFEKETYRIVWVIYELCMGHIYNASYSFTHDDWKASMTHSHKNITGHLIHVNHTSFHVKGKTSVNAVITRKSDVIT